MTRKEFIEEFGGQAAAMFLVACTGCKKKKPATVSPEGPTGINFTLDVSTGPLSTNGGCTYKNGVIVARTSSGSFVAIASTCSDPNGSGTLGFSSADDFVCPVHGATFDSGGNVTSGPATIPLKKYNTSLSGNTLHVYS